MDRERAQSLVGKDGNADIVEVIIEHLRERTECGARTCLVKIKAHRGEPLNELADTQAGEASQLAEDHLQWVQRTDRLIYEWQEKDENTRTSTWSKAVRRHPRPRSRPRSASPITTFVAIVDPSLHSSLSSIHRVDTAHQLHPCAHIALPSHLHAHGDLHPCTLHHGDLHPCTLHASGLV